MTPSIPELRALLAAATPAVEGEDPWYHADDIRSPYGMPEGDRALIAALSPAVVLGLLDRLQAAKGALAEARQLLRDVNGKLPCIDCARLACAPGCRVAALLSSAGGSAAKETP